MHGVDQELQVKPSKARKDPTGAFFGPVRITSLSDHTSRTSIQRLPCHFVLRQVQSRERRLQAVAIHLNEGIHLEL